jgi:hypothetical protein
LLKSESLLTNLNQHFAIPLEMDLIDPFPVSGITSPSLRMRIASGLIDYMTLYEQVFIQPVMMLSWGDELNTAVTMLIAVPLDKSLHPLNCNLNRCKVFVGLTFTNIVGCLNTWFIF